MPSSPITSDHATAELIRRRSGFFIIVDNYHTIYEEMLFSNYLGCMCVITIVTVFPF